MTRQTRWPALAALLVALLLTACAPAPSEAPAAAEAPAASDEAATEEAPPTEAPTPESSGTAAQDTSADAPSGIRVFVIVPEESTASYIADEEFLGGALAKYGIAAGAQDTVGSTQAIQGQFALNWDDLSTPLGENQFTVDLSTLTSDQRLRDGWLRDNGPEFATFPTATFVAERLENASATYTEGEEVTFQMVGQLTVRETAQPTTFDVTAALSGDTVTGVAETTILLTDFGIEPPDFANTLTVKNEMQIRVEFTAREQ
jgi:polyisoprenoid-binding protein YceI